MEENILKSFIELILPYIIGVLELMGIFIVTWSGLKAFWRYIRNTFWRKNHDLQYSFAKGLSTALEFKMAAEILKTVLVREMSELVILGAIIILRALVTILLKFEIRSGKNSIHNTEVNDTKSEQQKAE